MAVISNAVRDLVDSGSAPQRTTFSNVEQKGDYDSEGRAIMTRAELEQWFTIYAAKIYANTFHNGIMTTPLAKYKEGYLELMMVPGMGLPDRVAEPTAFMLDFMPFEERTASRSTAFPTSESKKAQ
jgi:putative transposase